MASSSSVITMLCFCTFVILLLAISAKAEGSSNSTSAPQSAGGGGVDEQYIAHGWLMWAAFGILFPSGIIAAKYGQKAFASWFLFHRVAQVLGVICGTVGLILAFTANGEAGDAAEEDSNRHINLGYAVAAAMWAVVILGFIRPKKGATLRPYWYFGHWLLGTASIGLAWYNILEGLEIVAAKEVLHTLFGIQISMFTFAYLFLDRWEHLKSQRTCPIAQTQPALEDPKKLSYGV